MLGHKTSFNKFKKLEIIWRIFSDHNSMKLAIKMNTENTKHAEAKQHATKHEWVKNEIQEEIKRYLETNENENTTT